MICNFCGEKIPENSFECSHCGMKVVEITRTKKDVYICPVCGAENSPGERKCQYCCSLFSD